MGLAIASTSFRLVWAKFRLSSLTVSMLGGNEEFRSMPFWVTVLLRLMYNEEVIPMLSFRCHRNLRPLVR